MKWVYDVGRITEHFIVEIIPKHLSIDWLVLNKQTG